jgi:hypothetical protein
MFEDIATAHHVTDGTVADLKMPSGRICRAAWCERGRITAWWPLRGPWKHPIALYTPTHWRRIEGVEAIASIPAR